MLFGFFYVASITVQSYGGEKYAVSPILVMAASLIIVISGKMAIFVIS
jgi:hypothetical protein